MKKETKIIVPPTKHKDRLDSFLSTNLKISRSQVQKMIADGLVVVNESLPKKAGDTVREGDKIEITQHNNTTTQQHNNTLTIEQLNNGALGTKIKRIEDYRIEIVTKTPDYIVVNKPSGLLVHPTQANEKDTLVAWLVKKYPKIKTVGDDPKVRPGIVHRLDKEASGLLVIAQTQPMFNLLKEQFKNRTVEKEYWALVHGKVAKDWDIITFPIARSETYERMAARPLAKAKYISTLAPKEEMEATDEEPTLPGEKQARTEFFVEKRFVNFTLLKVILHTGRMHQIRAHMLAYNHPLVGDPLYTQKKRKRAWGERLGRLFLHSTKLSFTDLNGNKQTFESPLPKELKTFLDQLS